MTEINIKAELSEMQKSKSKLAICTKLKELITHSINNILYIFNSEETTEFFTIIRNYTKILISRSKITDTTLDKAIIIEIHNEIKAYINYIIENNVFTNDNELYQIKALTLSRIEIAILLYSH